MTPRWYAAVSAGVCLAAALCAAPEAAEFWDETPFQSWSDKQVQKVISDSPWAHEVAVALPPGRPTESGFGPATGRGGESTEPAGFGPSFRVRLAVSWRSALPVKQAIARSQAGLNGTLSAENQEFLSKPEKFYVIAVAGMPPQFGATPLRSIKDASSLKVEGKPPIPADDVTFLRNVMVMLVAFPRTTEFTLADREVEFVTKVGEFGVKAKFKLKDMLFHGQLSL